MGVPVSVPDYEGAKSYIFDRLARELSPQLYYHSLWHTRDDVLPNAERLAIASQLDAETLLRIKTAAVFHDTGYLEGRANHERISVRIMRETLPRFGYSSEQIAHIDKIIMATRVPQVAATLPEQILADADLDVLGRDDFWAVNENLRREMALFDTPMTDEAWFEMQIRFLTEHHYFSEAARQTRDTGKRQRVTEIEGMLSQLRTH
jgi:predicted metal-dependent HD superfamily phosphohydrolase